MAEAVLTKEEKLLVAHILDLAEAAVKKGRLQCGPFLAPVEASWAEAALHKHKAFYALEGGPPEAERKAVLLLPNGEEPAPWEIDSQLTWLLVEVNRHDAPRAALTHRDFLGSLLGLGLLRKDVGDIVVADGCKAWIFVRQSAARIILKDLETVGRYAVTCAPCSTKELPTPETLYTEVRDTVASLRLDGILSSAFSLSRNSAAEAIRRQLVHVNGRLCEKPDELLQPGCTLSLRGKGKAIFYAAEGESKKGRTFIVIHKLK